VTLIALVLAGMLLALAEPEERGPRGARRR
jgi:hypothetical protein